MGQAMARVETSHASSARGWYGARVAHFSGQPPGTHAIQLYYKPKMVNDLYIRHALTRCT